MTFPTLPSDCCTGFQNCNQSSVTALVALSTPTAVHSVWIRERFEANHEVTYQTINRFDFVPADALNQILFLGKPGKTAICLNIAEVN